MKKNQNFPFFWRFTSWAYFVSCLSMLIYVSSIFAAEHDTSCGGSQESMTRLSKLSHNEYGGADPLKGGVELDEKGITIYDDSTPVGTLRFPQRGPAIISLRGTDTLEELGQSLSDNIISCSHYFQNLRGYMFAGYMYSLWKY